MIVKKYEELLQPGHSKVKKYVFGQGFGFGFSEFSQYAVFAIMFWSAGKIIENNIEVVDGETIFHVDPTDVFTALFAIMFGA
jgi:ATP-binding cassette, subfamily B (MDR/TAP), member 1